MSKALKSIEDFRKKTLVELYEQCTDVQKKLIDSSYPKLEEMSAELINDAIVTCEIFVDTNTKDGLIVDNEKGRVKILVSLLPETIEAIKRIKKRLKSSSEANVMINAIRVLDDITDRVSKGNKFIFRDEKKKTDHEILFKVVG